MASLPTFTPQVITAYREMCELECANDYFVAGLNPETNVLELESTGRGGMARVAGILESQFSDQIAVALFRVTAVDARGTTTSFRTKLVHVIYVGPKTPVMRRARVASFNSAFKQPFTSNLAIQTSDVGADLTVASVERSLRASGGAHQPSSFDFTNASTSTHARGSPALLPGSGDAVEVDSIGNEGNAGSDNEVGGATATASSSGSGRAEIPRTPNGSRVYSAIFNNYFDCFQNKDVDGLLAEFSSTSRLCKTDAASKMTSIAFGTDEIRGFFEDLFTNVARERSVVGLNTEKFQPSEETASEGVVFANWELSDGTLTGFDTLVIVGGKIVCHTMVLVKNSEGGVPLEPIPENFGDEAPGISQAGVKQLIEEESAAPAAAGEPAVVESTSASDGIVNTQDTETYEEGEVRETPKVEGGEGLEQEAQDVQDVQAAEETQPGEAQIEEDEFA